MILMWCQNSGCYLSMSMIVCLLQVQVGILIYGYKPKLQLCFLVSLQDVYVAFIYAVLVVFSSPLFVDELFVAVFSLADSKRGADVPHKFLRKQFNTLKH